MTYTTKLDLYLASPSKRRAERTPKAAEQFRYYVTRFITEAGISSETGTDLVVRMTEWLNTQPYSSKTLAWVRGMLVQFFWWTGAFSYDDVNRVPRTPIQNKTTYSGYTLTEEEVGRIIHFFASRPASHRNATDYASLRNAAGVCVLALTGIRISQLTDIRFDDVVYCSTTQRMTIHVERQKNVEQTIKPIEFSTAKAFDGFSAHVILDAYMTDRESRYHRSEFLFCNEQFGKLSEEYWRKILRTASKHLSIERCNPHAFRAFVATEVATKHGLLAAAQVLDHTSTNTTMRYITEAKSTLQYLS